MTTPSYYLEARKRVEEDLNRAVEWDRSTADVDTEALITLLAGPPRPTVEEVAAALAEKLAEVGGAYLSNDEAAQAVIALFTTPEGTET